VPRNLSNRMKRELKLPTANAEIHPSVPSKSSRTRKTNKLRKPNDPIRTGILVFLVLMLVLASIATFVGGIVMASANVKASVALLAAFVATLRMEYSVIKRLVE
jgi:hypothetical protein